MAIKLQPLGDMVIFKPKKAEEKSKGGLILPEDAQEKPQEGKVVAVPFRSLWRCGSDTAGSDIDCRLFVYWLFSKYVFNVSAAGADTTISRAFIS